ncbi:HAD family hydrolase [Candidatus Bipolaricaulota bacterium]|nr:HAD family hydrolase [Candidatus Bipolaricaulota bacterium]TFH07310.1 MAG: HAD family hydrolase [Candidatus Atribacteria bacterium]
MSASIPNRDSSSARPFVQRGGAVLLDRDGVISQQTAFVNEPDDLNLIDGAAAAIARLNAAGWPVAIITNQGGIAMGYLSEEMLHKIHARLENLLAEEGAHVDAIFYCAHHEDAKLPQYKTQCECRKPNTGMLEQARDRLGIDLGKSVVVGDRTTDILAGIRGGCSTILVETGSAGKDREIVAEPDAEVQDITAAVDLILSTADLKP